MRRVCGGMAVRQGRDAGEQGRTTESYSQTTLVSGGTSQKAATNQL